MNLPDWLIQSGAGGALVAVLGTVGVVVKSRNSRAASDKRSESREAVAEMGALPSLLDRVERQDERIDALREEAKLQSERHAAQRKTDRWECDKQIGKVRRHYEARTSRLEDSLSTTLDEMIKMRQTLRRYVHPNHDRLVIEERVSSDDTDEDDTGVHHLRDVRDSLRIPTPPDFPAVKDDE